MKAQVFFFSTFNVSELCKCMCCTRRRSNRKPARALTMPVHQHMNKKACTAMWNRKRDMMCEKCTQQKKSRCGYQRHGCLFPSAQYFSLPSVLEVVLCPLGKRGACPSELVRTLDLGLGIRAKVRVLLEVLEHVTHFLGPWVEGFVQISRHLTIASCGETNTVSIDRMTRCTIFRHYICM